MTTLDVPARAAVPVFDDTDKMAYYDPESPANSVIVGDTGTRITVESTTRTGQMKVLVD